MDKKININEAIDPNADGLLRFVSFKTLAVNVAHSSMYHDKEKGVMQFLGMNVPEDVFSNIPLVAALGRTIVSNHDAAINEQCQVAAANFEHLCVMMLSLIDVSQLYGALTVDTVRDRGMLIDPQLIIANGGCADIHDAWVLSKIVEEDPEQLLLSPLQKIIVSACGFMSPCNVPGMSDRVVLKIYAGTLCQAAAPRNFYADNASNVSESVKTDYEKAVVEHKQALEAIYSEAITEEELVSLCEGYLEKLSDKQNDHGPGTYRSGPTPWPQPSYRYRHHR